MSGVTDELPEGWCVSTIDELCELNPKHDSSLKASLPVSFVPMAAVSEVEGQITTPEVRPLGEVKKGYTHFADGDVILAKITPCMENGKAASVRGMVNGLACGTTEFFVFRSRGAIDQDYLFKFIRQESFRRAARATMQSGVGQARVPKEFVLETEIPLAPLPEQRRIVAKIEALQSRSRKAREALEAIPPLLEQFRQSVLAAAFRGDLTADWREQHPDVEPASVLLDRIRAERRRKWEQAELAKFKAKGKVPKDDSWKEKYVEPQSVDDSDLPELPNGWCWASVDELSVVITSGSRDWTQYYGRGTGTFVMAQNIRPGRLDFSGGRQVVGPPRDDRDRERSQILRGDILITIVGANTGDICGVTGDFPEHYVCQSVALIRLTDPSRQSWVMRYFLAGARGRKQLDDVIYGQGRPHLGFDDLRRMPVPVPPAAEQAALLPLVTFREKCIGAIKEVVESTTALSTQLDQSILAKAFRGELVPQDPDDEPASVLLERIRAERADDANGKPSRGRRKRSKGQAKST